MSDNWHYVDKNGQSGPHSIQQLREILARNPKGKDVFVWREGFADWKRVEDTPELRVQPAKPPPVPQWSQNARSDTDINERGINVPDYFALVSGLAISTKRLHDRDKSAWWFLVFFLLPGVLSAIAQVTPNDSGAALFGLSGFLISVWGLIELGCMKGDEGVNSYGANPLARRTD
jgi:hypothetical protein